MAHWEAEPTRARYPDDEGFVTDEAGVRVFWEVYGERSPTILFVPPYPIVPGRGWRAQTPYLSRHFRVITVDPRGNGRSDRPRERSAYSRAAHVADCIAVLDATATDQAIVISQSPRAPLALALCVEHPERVCGAVFITPQLWPIKAFTDPFMAPRRDRYEGYEHFNPYSWIDDYEGFIEWFARAACSHPHSTRQIELTRYYAYQTDGPTLLAATIGFEMYEREEALALAGDIRCPVLVTQNGGRAFWPKDTSGPFAEASGGRLHVFDGLGPTIPGRWPVAMNLVLREFAESVRAAA